MTASYRVPPVTVQLGTVLDLRIERGQTRTFIDDWAGWLLLTDERGMDSTRPRLWLLPPTRTGGEPGAEGTAAGDTYDRWHKRPPATVEELHAPDEIGHLQGRVLAIGYRSDKWGRRGEVHDYDHDFTDGKAPKLYTSHASLETSVGAVIVGGDMRITERGID